ncbi:hypothetical protein [Zooshikella ganghwensis]|uniref:Uncharacterized protein n=1 Tax=Zooshikella ganghwensis TaxID=202772 RepID=A0A4P9VQP6_9GAMM|nr:hypothetical protein [Zooshikella ganghwensis]RDH45853.1 hypothetical protein B9G39_21700 [Zooshikella ganghwensis]
MKRIVYSIFLLTYFVINSTYASTFTKLSNAKPGETYYYNNSAINNLMVCHRGGEHYILKNQYAEFIKKIDSISNVVNDDFPDDPPWDDYTIVSGVTETIINPPYDLYFPQ